MEHYTTVIAEQDFAPGYRVLIERHERYYSDHTTRYKVIAMYDVGRVMGATIATTDTLLAAETALEAAVQMGNFMRDVTRTKEAT